MDSTDDIYEVDSPIVKRMLKHFRTSSDAENDNRARGLRALKFRQGGDNQWDEAFIKAYKEDNRPHESYNQIPQFVHQITNDMRMNMAQIRFVPSSDEDKEKAEIYEDLVRAIQTSSEAEVAYDTAADSQVTIGWGYWRYITSYENDKTWDQVIKTRWVPNTFTCYDDPFTLEPDRSDRKKFLQVCDINVKDFNAEYDKDYDSDILQSIGDGQPAWASDDTVRVAEYWELTETKSKLYRKKATSTTAAGEPVKSIPKGAKKDDYEEREVNVPKVMWYKCTALEIIEEREWPGNQIPYVFVGGEQLNIDGQWKLSGVVEAMIPCQKQYNYWSNAATEMVALAPKAPYLIEVSQVADPALKAIWDSANIRNYPYLPYKATTINGQVIGAPQRNQQGADISSMIALVQQSQNNFYATTGIYPASLGKQGNEQSGKAIIARQREGDVSTFHFSDNMARAQRAGGRILEDLIKKIYDGARTIRGVKEDRTSRDVKVNQKYQDPDTGETKEYDLTDGYYDVVVTTGPSFTTKRQESQEFYQSLISSYPELMAIGGDIVIGQSDMAGADKLAERIKKTLPPNLTDDKPGEIPPEIQAQMEQLAQQNEQLQQVAQQQQQELQSKEAENQVKQMDAQVKVQEAQYKAQSDQVKAQTDQQKLMLDAEKINLERDKMEFEREKLHLDLQSQLLNSGEDMKLTREALQAQLQAMDEDDQQRQQRELEEQNEQDIQAQAEFEEQQRQTQKEQDDAAYKQALMNNLVGIQQNLQLLTSSIIAPKKVVRDPQTNMVVGVVTDGTIN